MQNTNLNVQIWDIVSNVPDGQFVFIENLETGVSNWSRDAVEYFGLPGVNVENTKDIMKELVHPDDMERYLLEMQNVFSVQNDSFFLTYQIKNSKGEYVPCTGKGKILLGEDGKPLIFTGSMTIHEGVEVNDAITDLPKFQTFLKQLSQTKKIKKECLLMLLEIKRFNSINALYGYNFGSKTLYEIARIVKKIVGDGGKVYRLEGISFGIIFKKIIWNMQKVFSRKSARISRIFPWTVRQ